MIPTKFNCFYSEFPSSRFYVNLSAFAAIFSFIFSFVSFAVLNFLNETKKPKQSSVLKFKSQFWLIKANLTYKMDLFEGKVYESLTRFNEIAKSSGIRKYLKKKVSS